MSLYQPLLFLWLLGIALAGWDAALLISARMNKEPVLALIENLCDFGGSCAPVNSGVMLLILPETIC